MKLPNFSGVFGKVENSLNAASNALNTISKGFVAIQGATAALRFVKNTLNQVRSGQPLPTTEQIDHLFNQQ